MARNRNADLLAKIPLFDRCSDKELARLSSLCNEMDLPAGSVLTTEGGLGHEFFVLVTGTAEVSKGGRTVATLGAGAPVGELALLAGAPRSATVTATSDVHAMVMSAPEFWEAVGTSPGLDKALLSSLADRLRTAMEQLQSVAV